MDVSKNFTNMINLLKAEYGASGLDLSNGSLYELGYKNDLAYLYSNRTKNNLDIVFGDMSKIATKTQFIFSKWKPVSVYNCSLEIGHSMTNIKRTKINIPSASPLPKRIKAELETDMYISDNSKYLFAVPLREDLDEVLIAVQKGEQLQFFCDGEHIRTLNHSTYDKDKKLIYSDSWSYILTCIKSIENKVQTAPMRLLAKQREELRTTLWEISSTFNSGEVIDYPKATEEVLKFVELIKKELIHAKS